MKEIFFATTNEDKVKIAQKACTGSEIKIKPVSVLIDEIQSENPELILKDKAQKAFDNLSSAVVVSDDSWNILALNGFPGAYMKSINHWFEPEDFLRLMNGIKDRRIILHQYLAFTDGAITKIFRKDIPGTITTKARGQHKYASNASIVSLDGDNGKTIAEVRSPGIETLKYRNKNIEGIWEDFIEWYQRFY